MCDLGLAHRLLTRLGINLSAIGTAGGNLIVSKASAEARTVAAVMILAYRARVATFTKALSRDVTAINATLGRVVGCPPRCKHLV